MPSLPRTDETGTDAISSSLTVQDNRVYLLLHVSVTFDTAPTTSEDITVTLDAAGGSEYDITLYTVDPSSVSMTSLLWQPDERLFVVDGDVIRVAYTNTDARTYGVQIVSAEI